MRIMEALHRSQNQSSQRLIRPLLATRRLRLPYPPPDHFDAFRRYIANNGPKARLEPGGYLCYSKPL